MATIKLKKKPAGTAPRPPGHPAPGRQPVRGHGAPRERPTAAQAQAERAGRAARDQRNAQDASNTRHEWNGPDGRDMPGERHARDERNMQNEREVHDKQHTRREWNVRDEGNRPGERHAPRQRFEQAPPGAAPRPRDERPPAHRPVGRAAPSSASPPASASRDAGARGGPVRPLPPRDRPVGRNPRPEVRRDQPPRADGLAPKQVAPAADRAAVNPPQNAPHHAPPRPRHHPPDDDRHDDDGDRRPPAAHAAGSLRLSKRMSELGIASRREADEWIAKGWVRVDDRVVSELGSRVVPGQRITVDARARHQQAQRVTVLVNKPVGIVSGQAEDGYEPALTLVTPERLWAEDHSGIRFLREHLRSLVPAGRLDIDSVGLLVLTQDGRIARQLVGEDSEVEKEYLVRVAHAEPPPDSAGNPPPGPPSLASPSPAPASARSLLPGAGLDLLRHGLELDGEPLRPAQVEWVNDDQLRFVLRQGRKRQIRRMCEAVGLQVLGLKRVRIGGVVLGNLPTGQWRYLRPDEAF